jgi:hypothetical protein
MNAANTQQWFVGLSESTNDYVWYSTSEKMRITTAGSLLVGTTSSWTGCAAEFRAAGNALSAYNTASAGTAFVSRVNNTGAKLATWNYNGSDVGTVTTDGTNSAYNAVGALIFGTSGSTERARIDTSGNLCVGSSSAPSGVTSAVTVNANALLNGKGPTNVANNGTITINCSNRFTGFLTVACINAVNASIRTSATYSVFIFDNDNTSIQQIHTANGSGGGSTFTVAYAATGFLITNTSGGDRNLMAALVGTIQT